MLPGSRKNKNHFQIVRKFILPDNLKVTLPFPAEVPSGYSNNIAFIDLMFARYQQIEPIVP